MMSLLFCLLLLLPWAQEKSDPAAAAPSEAKLTEGHYRVTVTIEDTSRGRGVAEVPVAMKLRRGFLILGRKKTDLALRTNSSGQVIIYGLPSGKIELLLYIEKDRPQKYEADLQPGLDNRVQLRSGRYSMQIEWKLL